MHEPHMEELDDTECRRLLAEWHLGRLAIPDFGGLVRPQRAVLRGCIDESPSEYRATRRVGGP